jgi:tetratricopeptide (TPR) repeat protein
VGRESELRALAASLKEGGTTAITPVAATGWGGVGKTQLAVEFVHRYGQYFAGGVFWLSFADAATVPIEVAACTNLEQHPDLMRLPPEQLLAEQVRVVRAAWQRPLPRLLVFDNCEDETLLEYWQPPTGAARVLVTSRRGRWHAGVRAVPVTTLSRAESVELLRKHRPDLSENDPTLAVIVHELGGLPLALELAGRYLARYRSVTTPAAYLEDLRQPGSLRHRSLINRGISHELSVARTFELSYNRLDAGDPTDTLARALLVRAAYLAPGEPILRGWLMAALELDSDDADAPFQAEDALGRLQDLGLLEQQDDDTLRLHRLLARFVLDAAADPAALSAVERMVLEEAGRLRGTGYPALLAPVQPHLRAVTDRAMGRGDGLAGDLCNELGTEWQMLAAYKEAKLYFERALAIREQTLGPDHSNTAASLNNLALLLRDQGDYVAARPLLARAMAINTAANGPDHPEVATNLNNLATVLRTQGDYAAARPLYERALAICEQTLGPEHPTTVVIRENLASLPS